jgi:hypothetical protein
LSTITNDTGHGEPPQRQQQGGLGLGFHCSGRGAFPGLICREFPDAPTNLLPPTARAGLVGSIRQAPRPLPFPFASCRRREDLLRLAAATTEPTTTATTDSINWYRSCGR